MLRSDNNDPLLQRNVEGEGVFQRQSTSLRFLKLAAASAMIAAVLAPQAGEAKVKRFVVEEKLAIAGGGFGNVGRYERLKGTAYFEVDPKNPLNDVIVNLDKATTNKRGMVEFSSPFVIVKPIEMRRGNGKIWVGLNNRGNCIEYGFRNFNIGGDCNPETVDQLGVDNPLFTQGFTWVDAGWHGDGVMPPDRSQLYPDFPVARKANGKPIVGPHRVELQPASEALSLPLVSGFKPYPTADMNTDSATLTVRDTADAKRRTISSDKWAFGVCATGKGEVTPSETDICLFDGFKANKIYELKYQAKNPIVMGLAHAVARDIGSFLRFEPRDEAGNPNPLMEDKTKISRAYLSGTSSTGMYMREFLYLGFNEDEDGKKVYDGVTVYSGGAHRLFANVQFASPTYYSGQDQHQDYTSNAIPPFTFAVTKDPVTGLRDGILKRPRTDPLVMQIDEELVFWQWKASLNVVDSSGKSLPIPPNVRLYFQGGWGHIGAAGLLADPLPASRCDNQTQPITSQTLRALVKVMDDWADHGVEPPPSNYPTLGNRQLVTLDAFRRSFPRIPGVSAPSVINELRVLDFGPYFDSMGGVQTILPPSKGPRYNVLVPGPREDGDGRGGVDTLFTRAPIGTNVGWNIQRYPRDPDLCSLSGSFVPFATTKAERLATGDSRLSLRERYKDHEGFVDAVTKAARQLVKERFMLSEDADRFIAAAKASKVLN
jgi:hypothetical protein